MIQRSVPSIIVVCCCLQPGSTDQWQNEDSIKNLLAIVCTSSGIVSNLDFARIPFSFALAMHDQDKNHAMSAPVLKHKDFQGESFVDST